MRTIKKSYARAILAVCGMVASQLALAGNAIDPETGNNIVSVPEPETLALFALGVAAIAIARRFRK